MADREFAEGCAVIFGGSGGIGGAVSARIARTGSSVVIVYHANEAQAQRLAAEIVSNGGSASAARCDIRCPEDVEAVFASAAERHGPVHSVISAQGAKFPTGPMADADEALLRAKLEIDVFGFLNIVRAAVPEMRRGSGGSLTAIVSPAIKRTIAGYGLGVLPKSGVATIVQYLAMDEGPYNIRANAVAPGVVNSGMAQTLRQTGGGSKVIIEAAMAATPLRRMAEPEEIAEVVTFLASQRASFVTGQVIMADGGYSL